MTCDRARTLYLAGDAGDEELAHLDSCAACRDERSALQTTRRALSGRAMWAEPAPHLADQVVAMISGLPAATAEEPTRRAKAWRRLAAVAAVVVIAIGLGIATRPPAPDWEVAMPGTDAAPGATASVKGWNEEGGTRLLLNVSGLPDAPAGSVYEFWLTRDAVHVSAGTFTAAGDVELWVGVTRRDYPRLWVTLETLDEDESLSGINVMDTGY
jgi:hypothetical protein